jgi:acetyltransferase-like isoleucine patch superfamily enzyme
MKAVLKSLANGLATVVAVPLLFGYVACRLLAGRDQSLAGFSQFISIVPGGMGVYIRRAFFRFVLPRVGDDVHLGFGVLLTSANTKLGSRAYIGPYCVLGTVTLEDDVLIASHVSIINGGRQHGSELLDVPMREQRGFETPVTIGEGSWIGERAVVMQSVGQGCIVGAGAVVTRPLPDFAVAVGVPARIVRFRDAAMPPMEEQLEQEALAGT